MARVQLLSFSDGVIQTNLGQSVVGAACNIYTHGTATQVLVYASEGGVATLSQPLLTDTRGRIPGWVDEAQRLDVLVQGTTFPLEAFSGAFYATVAKNPGSQATVVGSSAVVVGTNMNRRALAVWNDDATSIIYLALGTTAQMNQGPRVNPNGDTWPPAGTAWPPNGAQGFFYTGAIMAVASAPANLTILEI